MKRPKVITRNPADQFAMSGERIVEVSSDAGGCLISLRQVEGHLIIEVYRADSTVIVHRPSPESTPKGSQP